MNCVQSNYECTHKACGEVSHLTRSWKAGTAEADFSAELRCVGCAKNFPKDEFIVKEIT